MNILDPQVKIGGWSNEEQSKIFDLMKENFTSWSSISKSLNGRTENSIKNYFYSTLRRVQSCKAIDYFITMKQEGKLPFVESEEMFYSAYQLNTLNLLGVIIWLRPANWCAATACRPASPPWPPPWCAPRCSSRPAPSATSPRSDNGCAATANARLLAQNSF